MKVIFQASLILLNRMAFIRPFFFFFFFYFFFFFFFQIECFFYFFFFFFFFCILFSIDVANAPLFIYLLFIIMRALPFLAEFLYLWGSRIGGSFFFFLRTLWGNHIG